ncbi:Helix-turn-helix domain-containing protein [Micromonospora nigra]|uniref:Helix-turn-helix domain-containing protein n=1 Tax=Micromonospora nigra TaxID=145857 RepID=A0A1C6S626_9ACTN|nr:helix-turn-helix transcriptional regulator [Micromonospora nigra]SCL24924.1 Helix-turn-helix domain-containing protein [Micromonospora nigra]
MDETIGEPRLDLGVLLRAARRRADLSQRELAVRSGVPHSTVARIESGRAERSPPPGGARFLRACGFAVECSHPLAMRLDRP